MKGENVQLLKKVLVLIGLIIALFGFSQHFANPAIVGSTNRIDVLANDSLILDIELHVSDSEQTFRLDLTVMYQPVENACIAYVLTSAEYNQYLNGTPITELGTLYKFENNTRGVYDATIDGGTTLYLILFNNAVIDSFWFFFYSSTPLSYFPTALIGFSGLFLIVLGLMWYFNGWKRYFMGGLAVNLTLFIVRIFTLTTYSLGLPDIFESLIHIELYNDYQFFYVYWIPELFNGVWPYSNEMLGYIYPPLWIYSVSIFGYVPPWLPGLILFSFNVLTGILIYKIAYTLFGDEKRSTFVMLLYLLNPITALYGSFMWLNPTPFVFFVVLAFQQALEKKERNVFVAIAIATLYKQFAVIFFPILSLLFIKHNAEVGSRKGVIHFLKHTILYAGIVGVISLPFLILSFDNFVGRMFITGSSMGIYNFVPGLSMTVQFNTFFLWLGFPEWFTNIIAFLLLYFVPLIISGIIIYLSYRSYKPKINAVEEPEMHFRLLFTKALLWSFTLVMVVQTFYPRGSYKFYLLALIPFAILLFDYEDLSWCMEKSFKFSKRHLFVPLMIISVFVCYRYVYLWILSAWTLFYLWKSCELANIKNSLTRRLSRSEDIQSVWDTIYSDEEVIA